MKITKTTEDNTTTYFYDGVKKYEHYKASNGLESWSEYKDGEEIHHKNSEGYESWSNDNPENPENWIEEEDIKPFEFGNKQNTTETKNKEKEKQLFDMVYQWGRIGLKTDENCNAFQELLSEIIETQGVADIVDEEDYKSLQNIINCYITVDKVANNILGFTIECKGYEREYPSYRCDELTAFEDFMYKEISNFLNEIKNYPKLTHTISI